MEMTAHTNQGRAYHMVSKMCYIYKAVISMKTIKQENLRKINEIHTDVRKKHTK